MVCNGFEIGGGSIRIHQQAMQQAVFDVIGLTQEEARSQFGFLLDAFKYGPPPHGGMAFGWDRIIMLLAGAESIRDVIAFPKAASGADPLTGAPTPITAAQRKEAGVDAVPAPQQKPSTVTPSPTGPPGTPIHRATWHPIQRATWHPHPTSQVRVWAGKSEPRRALGIPSAEGDGVGGDQGGGVGG